MKERHGEFIFLHWEERPPYEVVKGHVPTDAFAKAVASEVPTYRDNPAVLGAPTHCYGRWAQDARARDAGDDSTFYAYQKPGRGRFPVTIACYANESIGFKDPEPCA